MGRFELKTMNFNLLNAKPLLNHSKSLYSITPYPILLKAKKLRGKVTSISMEKTVTVTLNRLSEDPIYGKRSKSSKNYLAHVDDGVCTLGDYVELKHSRPISKRKRYSVCRIISSSTA